MIYHPGCNQDKNMEKKLFPKARCNKSTTLFSSPSDTQMVPNDPCKINYLANTLHAKHTKHYARCIRKQTFSMQIILIHFHYICTSNCKLATAYFSIMLISLECNKDTEKETIPTQQLFRANIMNENISPD